uniref:Uncharacterized protein n=1 Tax=Lepeophtheirus salmonis TaxID=72036 RepID=A0A0K2T9F7_LEPSM
MAANIFKPISNEKYFIECLLQGWNYIKGDLHLIFILYRIYLSRYRRR